MVIVPLFLAGDGTLGRGKKEAVVDYFNVLDQHTIVSCVSRLRQQGGQRNFVPHRHPSSTTLEFSSSTSQPDFSRTNSTISRSMSPEYQCPSPSYSFQ